MNHHTFLHIYEMLKEYGIISYPRKQKVLEVEDFIVEFHPYERFNSYVSRNLNLDYMKEEFLWYLRANPYDDIITDSAQMWKDIRQKDGSFLSNYGVYWFRNGGVNWVMSELIRDKDSRRAVIPMLRMEHLFQDNPDVVCTYGIGFRIRNNALNMSVNMRSNDAIWGLTNDVACFSFLHEMILSMLKTTYPLLEMGTYCHKTDSLHVYERHFDMLDKILSEGESGYYEIKCPRMVDEEAISLRSVTSYTPISDIPLHFEFTLWLIDDRYRRERVR